MSDTLKSNPIDLKQLIRKTGNSLRRRGFRSRYDRKDGYFHVTCEQCEVLVINGIACHEAGCPNAKKSQ